MDVLAVDLGLLLAFAGAVGLVKPLRPLGLFPRRRGAAVLTAGLALVALGLLLPVTPLRLPGPRMLLDEVVPVYEFGEHHEILIAAPRDRVFAAVRAVTAREIRFFRLLTWIR